MIRENTHWTKTTIFVSALSLLSLGLFSCGTEVDEEALFCQSDECWDVSDTTLLKVNDSPVLSKLYGREVYGWRFPANVGNDYSVKVTVTSGSCHTYVSQYHIIDFKNNELTDYYSNNWINLEARKGEYYIAVEGTGKGCDYSVRVISYDENLEPLDGTIFLYINDEPATLKLIAGEIIRFRFYATRGTDYTVRVRVLKGKTDTYLSLIPSVDQDVYDISDSYSNNDIPFRAAYSAIYYVAVVDRGNITGSDFTIEVTSP